MAGTTFDIVVLSSSPPAHDLAPSSPLNGSPNPPPRRVAMSPAPLRALSPPASPQKIVAGASALGSRKASIPPDAIRGFATVGSLVRSEHFAQQEDDHIVEPEQPQKKVKKRIPKAPAPHDDDSKPKPKPRSRKPKAADDGTTLPDPELRLPVSRKSPYFSVSATESTTEQAIEPPAPKLTKSGKPRKPRAKKQKVEGDVPKEVKPKKSRVTKPKTKTDAKATGKAQREDACVESAHFRKAADIADDSHDPELATREVLDSEDADNAIPSIWEVPQSPPKKKRPAKQRPPGPIIESLDLEEAVSRRRDWTPPRDTVIASPFTDSVGKENKQVGPDVGEDNFTHMISNFTYAHAPPAVREQPSVSTKESVTITKRRRVQLVDVPGNQHSRNSSPEKGKAPKKKPRTITDIATEQYQVREEPVDPSNIASEFFQSRSTVSVTKVPLNDVSEANGDAPKKKAPRKRSTSKENDKGTKAKSKTSTKASSKNKLVAEKLLSPGSALARMNRQDILFGTSSQLALEESPTFVRQIQFALKESDADTGTSLAMAPPPLWPGLKAKGKRGLWNASSRDVAGGLLEQEDVYIPDFDRTQEIPLLMDGTTESLISNDVDGVEVADGISSADFDDIDEVLQPPAPPKTSPPPEPRRRLPPQVHSKKPNTGANNAEPRCSRTPSAPPATTPKGSGRFDDIDEILDSEDELLLLNSPTPPRFRPVSMPLELFSPESLALEGRSKSSVSTSVLRVYCIPTTELDWPNHRQDVFSAIAAHVRSLQPSNDPKRPNWHEKILMFVPIVLEDFTAYLNAQTRIRGWRRATKAQTKEWNKELKEKGEDAVVVEGEESVLAVERDLEPWQVQAWCESMSVCCIQGNSRKGTARRGFY